MKVRISYQHPDAQMPTLGTSGAACFDLHSVESGTVPAHGSRLFDTGLVFEVPEGHALLLFSRSGHVKQGIRLANSVGVIDSDYRGTVRVCLANDRSTGFDVRAGERIAQGMIVPVPRSDFEVVAELMATERSVGGFGSTGK